MYVFMRFEKRSLISLLKFTTKKNFSKEVWEENEMKTRKIN